MTPPPPLVAVVLTPTCGALVGVAADGTPVRTAGGRAEVLAVAARLGRVRWAWWAARDAAPALRAAGIGTDLSWDAAEAHRLRHGGWRADPATLWAAARGLPTPTGDGRVDLFSQEPDGDAAVLPDGSLRRAPLAWARTPERTLALADALAEVVAAQAAGLRDRHRATVWSESAAAVLCTELEEDGLPLDVPTAERLVAALAGPRPHDDAEALATRARRDAEVLRHAPGHDGVDLRSPGQVKELLAAVGLPVPDTRKHTLLPLAGAHPLVPALLQWRAAERIATTYGYRWLDTHVRGGRLRGAWTSCDGAAGRMTAQNGLHNLPAELRPAVRAEAGHVLVRADLGQVEPRVLAAVSGDPAFAAASGAADLYSPVAAQLGADRATAKVAVLAAMYGGTSGAAGTALRRLTRAYPQAVAHLDRAYAAGVAGGGIRTYGGRLVDPPVTPAADPRAESARAAARGRFLRNALIQGAAAELFKAWAATVRVAIRPYDASIVLCLHDELLVHAPAEHGAAVAAAVDQALVDAARRWQGGEAVTFVADTAIVSTWAEAKG